MNTMRNAAKAIVVRDGDLLVTVNHDGNGGEFYLLPGGGQEFGETLHETLRRECMEEIGADVKIGHLVCIREYIGKNHEFAEFDAHVHQMEFMFLCTLHDDSPLGNGILPDSRQTGVKWIRLSELPTAPFYPAALKTAIAELALHRALYLGDIN